MTYLFFGDTELAARAVPNPRSPLGAAREGARYVTAGGQQNLTTSYQPGVQYARHYQQTQLRRLCDNTEILSDMPLPNTTSQPSGIPTAIHTGEITFSCQHGKLAMKGYVMAQTQIIGPEGQMQTWGVDLLYGFLTPAARFDDTLAIVKHMIGSARVDQAWQAREREYARANVEAAQRAYAEGERTRTAVNQRMAALDANFEAVDDIVTGTGHYVDPNTGDRFDLDNSKPVKWIGPAGRIVGTTTDTPPGDSLSWRKLDTVK